MQSPSLLIALVAGFAAVASAVPTNAADLPRIALADFYYLDTSGEPGDRATEHQQRVDLFETVLREQLTANGRFEVVALECPLPECGVGSLSVEDAVNAAERVNADYVLLGAIQKISTLIGTGRLDLVDVPQRRSAMSRVLSFRGDSDEAFRRAAEFSARNVVEADLSAAAEGSR
ncbi:DUF2380 domain-containing protein [Aurantimonas aggregata]|uniref:DUF2380 domain-containing protein n=1 Tax=Aurantimonas aggregata TaxID=2047720 RepID=A0A6L9ME40_9HYPH|nr:DUF2380 domain-containing protein [Aurantimonas aggregata]NDV85842.1 DUF2380 domain-containing protein [Aurantimonas aggregata]